MFGILKNECIIRFDLKAVSPLCIRSGENIELDPSLPDSQFIRSHHDGEYQVVIPGSSIKGVFRSRVEKILEGSCNIFGDSCAKKIRKKEKELNIQRKKLSIEEKYILSCPACRMFGNTSVKSRIEFKDAFPDKNTVKLSTRHNVGIDRVTGSSKKGSLFEIEVLEQGTFKVEITAKNFFLWQIKVILQIIDDINDGYVTFGGVTSRGFGKMHIDNAVVLIREYGNCEPSQFYREHYFTFAEMKDKVKNTLLNEKEIGKVEFDERIL